MTIPAPLFRYFQILLEALKKDIGAAQKNLLLRTKRMQCGHEPQRFGALQPVSPPLSPPILVLIY